MSWWRYLIRRAISAGKVLFPPAFNYDEVVGKIWMLETGAYNTREDGTIEIELREPYGTSPAGDTNGGTYDNR